jgi:alpha-1,2-mannosyltransferase
MVKKVVVLFIDATFLLFLGVILGIAFTGGFSSVVGPLTIKAHNFKNPLIILMSALILRRLLTGSFFHGFLGQKFVKRIGIELSTHSADIVRRFAESPPFRKRVILGLCIFLLITVFTIVSRPLQPGLTRMYYDNVEWAGTPLTTTRDRSLDLTRIKREFPGITENYSLQWVGVIFIPASGKYQFTTISDDGSALYIDKQMVVDNRGFHGFQKRTGTVYLEKGFYPIQIRYMQGRLAADLYTYWTQPGKKRELLAHAYLFPEEPTNLTNFWIYRIRQVILSVLIAIWCFLIMIAGIGIVARLPQKLRFWTDISPLTVKLFILFLINGLAVNIILSYFGSLTTLYYTRFFVSSPAHARGDSWISIHRALEYLRNPHDDLLYTQVFFQERMKLQYPPTSLLAFKPFTGVSLSKLASGANFLSWLGIIGIIGIIARIFSLSLQKHLLTGKIPIAEKIARLVLAVCFTLTFYPLVKSFQLGQIQTWIYCLFVLSLWAWMAGSKALSGCLIGIICIIKPQLGLLALWGMLRKEWRFVIGVLGIAGTILIISLGVFGLANHLDYLQVLSYISQHGESYHPNQSVNGLLHRVFLIGTGATVNPFVFPPYNPWIYAGTLVSSLMLIAAALFWKRGQYLHAEVTDFSIAALSFTMASPIAWEHHYSVLLPLFVVALPATLASKLKQRGTILMAVSFVLSSNYYQMTNFLANTPLNFLQSYLFFGALLFLFHLYRLRDVQHASIE